MSVLKVLDEQTRDFDELVDIVGAIEGCTFVKPNFSEDKPEKIVTVAPSKTIRLMRPNSKLTGWIRSAKANDVYEKQLERYQNNQSCLLTRFEMGKVTEGKLRSDLTSLEKWFIQIVEPPPKKVRGKNTNYETYLKRWKKREHVKYLHSRSYYCENSAISYLNRSELDTIQIILFDQFQEVKDYYDSEISKK